jgi:hypothetical protein
MDCKRYRAPSARQAQLSRWAAKTDVHTAPLAMRFQTAWRTARLGALGGILAAGLGAAAAGGCRRWHQASESDGRDSTFVAALADLRRAVQPGGAETGRDSAGRAAVRDSILRKYDVTVAELEQTARQLAQDPDHAADVMRAVDRKVQSLTPAATAAAPAPPVAPQLPIPPGTTPGSAAVLRAPATLRPPTPPAGAAAVKPPPSAGSASRP